jgi:hypothetical protein
MIVLLVIVGFVAAGLVIGLIATASAPLGYQDESGFHFGPEYGDTVDAPACATPQLKPA